MKYKFSDLSKVKNYLGFESGVVCFFPNYYTLDILKEDESLCTNKTFFGKNYLRN
jgi:hypothetical protein